MFALADVRHAYGGQTVLDVPRFAGAQGERWLVLGHSGSGKSTLLHILAGLLRPTAGTVTVAGERLWTMSEGARDEFRGRTIGVVFQQMHLLPTLTVEQNVQLAPYLAGLPQRPERVAAVLESLGLLGKAGAYPHALSYGQQQRVAIARAVVNEPALLLADEPTSALDDVRSEQVLDLLIGQAERAGATLVVATHDARVKRRLDRHFALAPEGTPAPSPA